MIKFIFLVFGGGWGWHGERLIRLTNQGFVRTFGWGESLGGDDALYTIRSKIEKYVLLNEGVNFVLWGVYLVDGCKDIRFPILAGYIFGSAVEH